MRWLRGLIDRLLAVAAVVAGGLLPGYVAQYRQRLGGRLEQARMDLAPWQQLADHYHHGDLGQLIQYHLDSHDPTFHGEGAIIQALVVTVQQLQSAADALHASLWRQMLYLAAHADPGLARATYADWVPTFALDAAGLGFALVFAVLAWLLFQALWSGLALGWRGLQGTKTPAGRARRA